MAKLVWCCLAFHCLVGLMVLRFAVVDRSSADGAILWWKSLFRSGDVDYNYNNRIKEASGPEQNLTRGGREDDDDDPRCLSRSQLLQLRQASTKLLPEVPAVELQEEWARYGELHRKCTEGRSLNDAFLRSLETEKEQHEAHHGERAGAGDGCKYLVYLDGVEGLGNRFLSLASAWAYAMLTDRVLLIDTRRRIHELLCEPFPHSSWLLPPDFPYHLLGPSLGSLGTFNPQKGMAYKNGLTLYLRHNQGFGDSQLFCEDIQKPLSHVSWISWISNLYQVPHLFLVPSFWPKLRPIFPSPDHTFALISRLLLNPSNEIWSLVLQDYTNHLSSSKIKVGVQIRLLGYRWGPAGFYEEASDMIRECLMNNSLLPRVNDAVNERAISAQYTMNRTKLQSGSESMAHSVVDVGVQVASLQGQYYERIKDLYSGGRHRETVDGSVVRVHTLCSLSSEDTSFRQSQLAYAEMLLLSFSDKLATSASSTFGYMAQSWGNVLPLILDFAGFGKGSPLCGGRVSRSIDPCTHDPLVPQCLTQGHRMESLSLEHRRWLDAHLQYCQDRPSAWQLVGHDAHAHPHPVFDLLKPL